MSLQLVVQLKLNSPAAIFGLYYRISASLVIVFKFRNKIPALLLNLSAVTAMLPIMVKLNAILKLECVKESKRR